MDLNEPVYCCSNQPTIVKTSRTARNPGRRFRVCPVQATSIRRIDDMEYEIEEMDNKIHMLEDKCSSCESKLESVKANLRQKEAELMMKEHQLLKVEMDVRRLEKIKRALVWIIVMICLCFLIMNVGKNKNGDWWIR